MTDYNAQEARLHYHNADITIGEMSPALAEDVWKFNAKVVHLYKINKPYKAIAPEESPYIIKVKPDQSVAMDLL